MPRPYRSQWRSLAEARSDLVTRGFTPVDAEAELRRAIRDAVLLGAGGSGLHIRLDGSDNPWFSRVGPWLRDSPELDFDASTILIPVGRALPIDTRERTLRSVHGQPFAAQFCRPARIEILDADIDRIWGPENGQETPAEPDAREPERDPEITSPSRPESEPDLIPICRPFARPKQDLVNELVGKYGKDMVEKDLVCTVQAKLGELKKPKASRQQIRNARLKNFGEPKRGKPKPPSKLAGD
jgi:hypothetical protein